jgi:hypothetical protein
MGFLYMFDMSVRWRARGAYVSTLSSKSSLIDETKIFLRVFAQTGDLSYTCQELIEGELPHRSRETRKSIVDVLRTRLVHWHPPVWVLQDLLSFADDVQSSSFITALLLHSVRQDVLSYDFIQQVIVPRWYEGSHEMIRSDVQSFLDHALPEHPEEAHWSLSTREKISQNLLTVLRDGTLLQGSVKKHIVLPVVPKPVACHLIRLLRAEGVAEEQLASHPDWRIWLWDAEQANVVLHSVEIEEHQV